MSFIPFATSWVGRYPNSFIPLCHYFVLIFIISLTFHLMHELILHENNQVPRMRTQSIISLCAYLVAAAAGGFCPPAAFALVVVITICWILSIRKYEKLENQIEKGFDNVEQEQRKYNIEVMRTLQELQEGRGGHYHPRPAGSERRIRIGQRQRRGSSRSYCGLDAEGRGGGQGRYRNHDGEGAGRRAGIQRRQRLGEERRGQHDGAGGERQ